MRRATRSRLAALAVCTLTLLVACCPAATVDEAAGNPLGSGDDAAFLATIELGPNGEPFARSRDGRRTRLDLSGLGAKLSSRIGPVIGPGLSTEHNTDPGTDPGTDHNTDHSTDSGKGVSSRAAFASLLGETVYLTGSWVVPPTDGVPGGAVAGTLLVRSLERAQVLRTP